MNDFVVTKILKKNSDHDFVATKILEKYHVHNMFIKIS